MSPWCGLAGWGVGAMAAAGDYLVVNFQAAGADRGRQAPQVQALLVTASLKAVGTGGSDGIA